MSVQICYRIKDKIKISKNQLSTTFPMTAQCLFRSTGCFELLSYIHILYINVLLHTTLSKVAM